MRAALRHRGVQAALASALLFGAGTPAAKLLLTGQVSPWLLAGLLYTGSGLGLGLWRLVRRPGRVRIARHELPALAGAVVFGGAYRARPADGGAGRDARLGGLAPPQRRGAPLPQPTAVAGAMAVGLITFSLSLALFIVAMRHIGTARTGAFLSVAPFFGALLALLLGEPLLWPLVAAGALMAVGVWLHLTEVHEHEHEHEAITHDHWHVHDEHLQHDHR